MTMTRKLDKLTMKSPKTGEAEFVVQRDIRVESWGLVFFVDGEFEAYKAAYAYRFNEHGVKIEFTPVTDQWMVTVFNSKRV